jgi:hypothetical protein
MFGLVVFCCTLFKETVLFPRGGGCPNAAGTFLVSNIVRAGFYMQTKDIAPA